ncbi:MAG: cytochrome c peroxidase [Polyangiaceae bacterium]
MRAKIGAHAIGFVAALAACSDGEPIESSAVSVPGTSVVATREDPIEPVPLEQHLDPAKVSLGARLFEDPILSPNGDLACTTCHQLDAGGADGRVKSDLAGHEPAAVNTPTIFNVALNYRLHWNGKYEDLDTQLEAPITSPRVFNTTFASVVDRLSASPSYRDAFGRVYPAGITEGTFRDAMVTYERSLTTPNARLDRYLRGDKEVLSTDERQGYELFKSHGCISCHQGINVGGNLFQRFGTMRDYFQDRGEVKEADNGRYNVTKRDEDRFVFRVPSLRNVALTAPYFHDGSAKTLEDAVRTMSRYQLGRNLTEEETRLIVAFLRTLTGEYAGEALE